MGDKDGFSHGICGYTGTDGVVATTNCGTALGNRVNGFSADNDDCGDCAKNKAAGFGRRK